MYLNRPCPADEWPSDWMKFKHSEGTAQVWKQHNPSELFHTFPFFRTSTLLHSHIIILPVCITQTHLQVVVSVYMKATVLYTLSDM
jgi:hypothetical protein